jgi:hypothetical protein
MSAAVTFACLHVLPALDAYINRRPTLEIDLKFDDRNVDLLEEDPDVALRMGDLWTVFPSGRLVTARARAFVEFVEEALVRA